MRRVPWLPTPLTEDLDSAKWELYHIDTDYSEAHDLSDGQPQKLREMQDLFWAEATRYNVLPIDDRAAIRFDSALRPALNRDRKTFSFYSGTTRIPEGSAPELKNKSYSITAEVEIPPAGAEGVLVTQGGRFGGFSFYVQGGRLHYVYNYLNRERYQIDSASLLPAGSVALRFEFAYDGGGIGKGGYGSLFVNDKKVGEARIAKTERLRYSFDETFDVGEDTGTPATESYRVPFKFTGNLKRVRLDLK
jgi:arylsulfatase